MQLRKALGEIAFWLHLPIVLLWLGLFFVPERLLPGKIVFHFWFIIVVFASQILWGLVMMPIRGRFGMEVCPLTTLTQWLRGFPITDKRNFDHTFIQEFLQRLSIAASSLTIYIILLGSVALVIVEYFNHS